MGTIKFALPCDGQPVRTIEQLQENFNINDVLEHYESGKLADWLESRAYMAELEAVKTINKKASMLEQAKELCKIFNIPADESQLMQVVELEADSKEIELKGQPKDNIGVYIKEYRGLVKQLLNGAGNYEELLRRIQKEYKFLYELNRAELYWQLFDNKQVEAIGILFANDPESSELRCLSAMPSIFGRIDNRQYIRKRQADETITVKTGELKFIGKADERYIIVSTNNSAIEFIDIYGHRISVEDAFAYKLRNVYVRVLEGNYSATITYREA